MNHLAKLNHLAIINRMNAALRWNAQGTGFLPEFRFSERIDSKLCSSSNEEIEIYSPVEKQIESDAINLWIFLKILVAINKSSNVLF
jgi:hypothetical protein